MAGAGMERAKLLWAQGRPHGAIVALQEVRYTLKAFVIIHGLRVGAYRAAAACSSSEVSNGN